MKKANLKAKITFDDTVTYRDINLRDSVGTILPDDKRTSSSSKLWLVRWNCGNVGVEHVANLARLDESCPNGWEHGGAHCDCDNVEYVDGVPKITS